MHAGRTRRTQERAASIIPPVNKRENMGKGRVGTDCKSSANNQLDRGEIRFLLECG
jgi:hypothetical protein